MPSYAVDPNAVFALARTWDDASDGLAAARSRAPDGRVGGASVDAALGGLSVALAAALTDAASAAALAADALRHAAWSYAEADIVLERPS